MMLGVHYSLLALASGAKHSSANHDFGFKLIRLDTGFINKMHSSSIKVEKVIHKYQVFF